MRRRNRREAQSQRSNHPCCRAPASRSFRTNWSASWPTSTTCARGWDSETESARARERDTVATDFLPVLDSLERALDHADADPSLIREGIQAVRDQAVQILAKLGFARSDPLGEQFDPARHEAVASVNDPDAEPGTIVHVVHPGYGDGEHQLRPAAVVVATKGH